jgi:carboxymethylenebutenolidase
MPTEQIHLPTADGHCSTYVISPNGDGPWPAVILYGDAGGIRPAMLAMGSTLASAGYLVLLPDLYYRFGPYGPLVPKDVFKGDVMAVLGPLMETTGIDKAARDTAAFLAYLDKRSDIAGGKIAAVGFCMGGGIAIGAAATYPTRFSAVASFHGGNLATDAPSSPHLLVPQLKAAVYIAGADQDDTYPPAMAQRLADALTTAGVHYRSEIYQDAAHGWMVPDFPSYDSVHAERGWKTLIGFFEQTGFD